MGTEAIRRRLRDATGLGPDAPLRDVVVATHRVLARAPAHLVTATVQDALAVEERPSIPGTTRAESWSRALPLPLEEIMRHPLPRAVASALGVRGG